MLARYNEVVPNGAERIIALAESQSKHRQGLETAVVHGNLKAETRGQVFAFILGLVAIAGGIWLISTDKDAQGIASIITAFAGLAGVFIYGRWQQSKERAQKRKELDEAQREPRLPYEDDDSN